MAEMAWSSLLFLPPLTEFFITCRGCRNAFLMAGLGSGAAWSCQGVEDAGVLLPLLHF